MGSINFEQGLESIGDAAFSNCTALKIVNLPESLTEYGELPFSNCSSLEEINVSGDNLKFKSIDGVLLSKDGRILIDCPDHRKNTTYTIPYGVNVIEAMAFDSSNLVIINIPNTVTYIKDGAFSMSSIESLVMPDSILIQEAVCVGCQELKEVKLSSNLTEISDYSFVDCPKLTHIEIPNKVTRIGVNAFYLCVNMISMQIPSSVVSIDESFYYSSEYQLNNLVIYGVPGSYAKTFAVNNGIIFEPVIQKCSIEFELNGGIETPPETQIVYCGEYAIYPQIRPSRTGYQFMGWYTQPEGTGIPFFNIFNLKSIKPVYSDTVIYATWDIEDDFCIGKDSFTWAHTDVVPNPSTNHKDYKITGDYLEILLDGLKNNEKEKIKTNLDEEWSGSCLGLSKVVALSKANKLDSYFFQESASCIGEYQMPKENQLIFNLINYYQLTQNIDKVYSANNNLFLKSAQYKYDFIKEKVLAQENSLLPVIINLHAIKYDTKLTGVGHAVVAVGLKEIIGGYDIKIWDPNKIDDFRILRIKLNSLSLGVTIYEVDESGNADTSKKCYPNYLFSVRGVFYDASQYYANIETELIKRNRADGYSTYSMFSSKAGEDDCYILYTNYAEFTTTNAVGQTAIVSGLDYTGDLQIMSAYPENEVGYDPEYVYVLPAGTTYTIVQSEDEDLTSYKTMFEKCR